MPRRRQGYNMTHILIALITRYEVINERVLREVFGRRVFPYLRYLKRSGVVVIRDGIVSLNTSFAETVSNYARDIEKRRAKTKAGDAT